MWCFTNVWRSFLDSNNTDLIRWSDDGKSFIVLDEDEFARTLIPELFKHNNYASFVRQLNMYGFHKTVNITDGSLRQSEKARKGVKPPSMYSHPYFRRNRPDLLWLIQKPTGKSTSTKRKLTNKDGYDSDEAREFSPPVADGSLPHQLGLPNTSSSTSNQELTQLPRRELAQVRQELQKLQNQQQFISQMITQLKNQNDQFYRQAANFQALHDRHENSINAILTFLATFYNRSLEGHHGAQNLVNMFTNAQNAHNQQQQGSVVEEYGDSTPTPQNQVQRFVKRPPLLLPGPPAGSGAGTGTASTQPNSARQSISPPGGSVSELPDSAHPHAANSPAVKTEPATPVPQLHSQSQGPESAGGSGSAGANSNDEMMNLINSVNATTQAQSTPGTSSSAAGGSGGEPIDFNSIVDQYNHLNGSNPLTPQQRDSTLANIMRQTGNTGNALTTPGGGMANFDMNQLKNSRETMETLQNMQRRNAEQIANLSERLVPLSPSGSIPGLHQQDVNVDPFDSLGPSAGLGSGGFGGGDYDPNAFIDFDPNDYGDGEGDFDFGFDTSGTNNGADNDWGGNFDGTAANGDGMFDSATQTNDNGNGDGGGDGRLAPAQQDGHGNGGRVESVSSSATSPAATVPETDGDGGGGGQVPGTPNKRQRRS